MKCWNSRRQSYESGSLVMVVFFILALCAIRLYGQDAGDGEIRRMPPVRGIKVEGVTKVVVKSGTPQVIEINADKDVLPLVEVSVVDGVMIVKRERDFTFSDPTIYITATIPRLASLELNGTSSIVSEGTLVVDSLELWINGAGKMDLALDASLVKTRVSGAGSVELTGTAREHQVRVSGVGRIHASCLRAEYCDVSVEGAGHCRVAAQTRIDVAIEGAGHVRYTGDAVVKQHIAGVGRVVHDTDSDCP